MKKLHVIFLSLFLIINININLLAEPLSEEKRKQICQEFEASFGYQDSLSASLQAFPEISVNILVSLICTRTVGWLIGYNNDPNVQNGQALGSLISGVISAPKAYKQQFFKITQHRSFMKCNEHNLSGDECFNALKNSKPFKDMINSVFSPYKTPQEFKNEYNKTK